MDYFKNYLFVLFCLSLFVVSCSRDPYLNKKGSIEYPMLRTLEGTYNLRSSNDNNFKSYNELLSETSLSLNDYVEFSDSFILEYPKIELGSDCGEGQDFRAEIKTPKTLPLIALLQQGFGWDSNGRLDCKLSLFVTSSSGARVELLHREKAYRLGLPQVMTEGQSLELREPFMVRDEGGFEHLVATKSLGVIVGNLKQRYLGGRGGFETFNQSYLIACDKGSFGHTSFEQGFEWKIFYKYKSEECFVYLLRPFSGIQEKGIWLLTTTSNKSVIKKSMERRRRVDCPPNQIPIGDGCGVV